ncbi:CHAT domain-containing protein [Leptolyngbya sp. PCC 6406]|uniref:CHAT domain-containing protein n=1 Tax=Leptolyngbya sp. PCC 6406 TaxID=1173264 RepID=UPI0002ABEC9F|nr:CHAT domain-containing protein [Leptolyngbya sp. PCC 6406]
MPQEFHLSITNLGHDRYLIRTEDMVDGVPVAEALVTWPVDEWLKRSQPAMDDPILGLLQGRSPSAQSTGEDLTALGKDLYQALFEQDAIRESWHCAQGIAQHHQQYLRLRLGFKDSRLQRLPWEALHSQRQLLANRINLIFARYSAEMVAVAETRRPPVLPKGNQPLRVLMVVASPDDQTRLNLRQEVTYIQKSLKETAGTVPRVQITVLEQPDRSALTQVLEQGNHQVLHYAGHSDFGETGGDLHLVNQHTGLTERLSGEDLAGLLVHNNIYLAVFNSCRSGHLAGDDAEMDWRQQNLVQALVNRGVPSVIAMAERIPDPVAAAFTRSLYKNINEGYPIDLSLKFTRQSLVSEFSSDRHYWLLPVLYLQPEFDGCLTERDRTAAERLNPWDNDDNWATPEAHSNPANDALTGRDPGPSIDFEPDAKTAPNPGTEMDVPSNFDQGAALPLSLLDPDTFTPEDTSLDPTDASVAQLVEQLSQPGSEASTIDIPDLAAQEETLLPDNSLKQGLGIYEEALGNSPDNPTPPPSYTLPEQERSIPPYRGLYHTPLTARPNLGDENRSTFPLWMLVAGLGVAATLALGTITILVRTDPRATPTATSGTITSSDPDILRDQAQTALQAGDYQTAQTLLTHLLEPTVQARIGNLLDPNEQVRTLLVGYEDEQLLFVKGRAYWQTYKLEVGETPGLAQSPTAIEALDTAATAWADLVERRTLSPEGLVALGFARYAQGQVDEAIRLWEQAVDKVELDQRSRQPDPATAPLQEPIVLHAYGGLVLAYFQIATADLDADTTARNRAFALSYLEDLQNLDPEGGLSPTTLANAVGGSSGPQYSWLWTAPLLGEWSTAYAALMPELAPGTQPQTAP